MLFGIHFGPLEGGKGLGHKKGCADGNLAFPIPPFLWNFVVLNGYFIGKLRDGLLVFSRLCGQPQHKIEFYLLPAPLKGFPCALKNDFLRKPLIYHIPKALGACLRGEG